MISTPQKYAAIEQHIRTPKGRTILAASLQQPLRERRDYASVGRKAFLVDPLVNGALPVYEKDIDVHAYIVGEESDSISSVVKGKRILCPLFEVTALPEIPLTEITNRRFDVIERSVAKGTSDIGYQEDDKVFGTIDALLDDPTAPNADITVPGNLTPAAVADAFGAIERNDLRVAYMFMNARDFTDLRKWDRDVFDPISQAEMLKTGVRDGLYGAKIVVSRVIPEGTVYLTCEPEFFGRVPVRYDLTILSADNPKARTIGFSMFECLGACAFNPYGGQRIRIVRQ